MIYELENPGLAKDLFGNWEESLIWSCLQGIMGIIYTTDPVNPVSAMAILGDFAYYAGEPDRELIAFRPAWYDRDSVIMVPQNDVWGMLIRDHYGKNAKCVTRYAIKKETGIFEREKLQEMILKLPQGYLLCPIDKKYYEMCRAEQWSSDFVSHFESYEMFKNLGLGFVAVKDGHIVSGASSYSRYREGIEVEIATREEFRRKGLACVCGAKLILECMDRDLYPSWDARIKWSVALAEKLGYHFSHEYTAYEIQAFGHRQTALHIEK